MVIFSTHILNALNGKHASNVDVSIFKINKNGEKNLFFKSSTDHSGRLHKEFELSENEYLSTFEMIVDIGSFFKNESKENFKKKIVSEISVIFKMEDLNKKYHIPIIISPNSYSIWWSD